MKWLAKIFYYGRIKRLERIQYAAALVAQGETDQAEQILQSSRPTTWTDDLAVYHLVLGKLRMEQGQLDEAERHLHTAMGLGLERPSVKLNLSVLKVRRCELGAALALLDDVELSDDPGILEQARVMRQVIDDARRGAALPSLSERAARFRKKHLTRADDTPEATLAALGDRLRSEGKLSSKDREDAALLYGTVLCEARQGTWLLGLEPRDHRVLVGGVLHTPCDAVQQVLDGDVDHLPLPDVPAALPPAS